MTLTIPISQFKLHCVEIMQQQESNKQPIIITKRDKPIAVVTPYNTDATSLFGMLKHKAEIRLDIIDSNDDIWEV